MYAYRITIALICQINLLVFKFLFLVVIEVYEHPDIVPLGTDRESTLCNDYICYRQLCIKWKVRSTCGRTIWQRMESVPGQKNLLHRQRVYNDNRDPTKSVITFNLHPKLVQHKNNFGTASVQFMHTLRTRIDNRFRSISQSSSRKCVCITQQFKRIQFPCCTY